MRVDTMDFLDIAFLLVFLFTFATNALLIQFMLRRSQISIIFFVFGSILLTFSTFLARLGYHEDSPTNIVLFSTASTLIGIAILIAVFNLPELTPAQRFWQRLTGISGGIMMSISLTGALFPRILELVFEVPNPVISLILATMPAFLSFFGAFVSLLLLFITNRSLTQRLVDRNFDWLLVVSLIILVALPLTILDSQLERVDRVFLATLYGIVILDGYYLFLITYFVQRFPLKSTFREYIRDGTFGWLLSRMGDTGPEILSYSHKFAENWTWTPSYVERLAVTIVSFVGMGHESSGYEGLPPSFFSLHQRKTFVGIALPMSIKADLEDPRFKGKTLTVFTILLPYDHILSFNQNRVKEINLDHQKLLEDQDYVVEACVNALKRIFD